MEATAQILTLKQVTYKQFKDFLDSLDEERKSWSLDLQDHFKNDKEFYEGVMKNNTPYSIVCVYDNEVIGFCNAYQHESNLQVIEVSFVVKKEYHSQGIGSTLLKRVEWDAKKLSIKYIIAKHYKDNIASHKAFLKAGYEEWTVDKIPSGDGSYYWLKNDTNTNLDFKVKKIA